MILTALQIFEIARGGADKNLFPPIEAVTMTAIALRESGGDPAAYNGNLKTGDLSWGLWQINWHSPEVRALAIAHGIEDPKQLTDPAVSAKIAFAMWGGKNSNLDVAWYLNRDVYRQAYEAHLPAAQAAALASPLGL